MPYKTLLTSLENGIFIITINRPDKLNALNRDVMADLNEVTAEIEKNADIKAAIITGSGQKGFVAGADISEFVGLSASEGASLAKTGCRSMAFSDLRRRANPQSGHHCRLLH